MESLISVLEAENDWISASEAFLKCGIRDGAETDEIEKIYEELREYVNGNRVAVERHGDEDWIRLNQEKAA